MDDDLKRKISNFLLVPTFLLPVGIFMASPDETPTPGKLYDGEGHTHEWAAQEIELPHLNDGSRYTSNPDEVISDNTVWIVDSTMKRMDDELGVESAVVVVNHIADDDPFTFCQDLFDLYGIGREDRGLVISLAYGDHSVRMHTGRALEEFLTDAECSRLENDYLIPWMRVEQPDSGLISLTDATYQLLRSKQDSTYSALMPAMHTDSTVEEDNELQGYLAILWIVCIIAFLIFSRGGGVSGFIGDIMRAAIMSTFSGGGGGGGGRSGGYHGGSSGGGGATSRW